MSSYTRVAQKLESYITKRWTRVEKLKGRLVLSFKKNSRPYGQVGLSRSAIGSLYWQRELKDTELAL